VASRRQNARLQTLFAPGKSAGIFALHKDVSASTGAVWSRPRKAEKEGIGGKKARRSKALFNRKRNFLIRKK